MRYYLDADVNPAVVEIGRNLGLDVTSSHELGRNRSSDPEQLLFAAQDDRCMVTRNRDDFIQHTRSFMSLGLAHAGVLVVPYSLPNNRPEVIARALLAHSQANPDPMPAYMVDFLRPGSESG